MALRWTWSNLWISKTYFIFLFNLDVWEFMKVYKEAYISTQGYFTPSATVPMSYFTFAMATGGVILLLIGILYSSHPCCLGEELVIFGYP
jgi:hypothetical protein